VSVESSLGSGVIIVDSVLSLCYLIDASNTRDWNKCTFIPNNLKDLESIPLGGIDQIKSTTHPPTLKPNKTNHPLQFNSQL
jgi:hypothetical protein